MTLSYYNRSLAELPVHGLPMTESQELVMTYARILINIYPVIYKVLNNLHYE